MSTPPETQYLEGATGSIKQFFEKFHSLLDGETSDAAIGWSNSFAEDGEFHFPGQTYTGREALRTQREAFWSAFPGLVHRPLRVYPSLTLPLQYVVVNRFDYTAKDGERVGYTAAEYTLVERDEDYLIQKLVLYMDPAALTQ
ncbi:hypothetical protein BJX63DRAFT_39101 [Aspergillus granulosus]|uniref:SnoaL-like domain-containing protein n=1 Tax=Aspergillus granulosus TaxID=176169 RepID=A0ABR4GYS7_9EURO